MNKNDFIDNALKEHARLESNDDQDFLDQLESQLDEKVRPQLKRKPQRKKVEARRFFWPAVAATIVVSAYTIATMSRDGHSSMDEAEFVLNSKGPLDSTQVEGRAAQKRKDMDSARPESPALVGTNPKVEGASKNAYAVLGSGKDRFGNVSDLERERPIAPTAPSPVKRLKTDSSAMLGEARFAKLASPPQPLKKPAHWSFTPNFGEDSRGGIGRFELDRRSPGDRYGNLLESGFLTPLSAPLSTFSIDVDTASYSNIRRHIVNGQGLNPNAVRIEEMINYFDYNYAQPEGAHPFAVHTEVASCPWNPKHRLVKIGLQGKTIDEGERKAANLVFLLDVSGSMKSADKLPLLVQSLQILLKQLNENDRVSLVVYAGRQAVLLNPTAIDEGGRTQVSEALKKLSAGGSTAGAAGIKTAYDLARKGFVEGGVNRVILATDGDFNVGTTNHNELIKLVKNQAEGNISLTVLGFGQGNLNDAMMEKLTNSGDGNYFYIDSLREGQKIFQQGLTGTIQTIAKDVKIQVEFNPGKVGQYRLIGYANRRLRDQDFKDDKVDAGDIGAGHRVTALYEVVPAGVMMANDLKYQKVKEEPKLDVIDSPEMLTVKLRYKQAEGKVSTEIARALTDEGKVWEAASEDFRFSSGVALWGMLLRNSSYSGGGTPELVSELALGGQGEDLNGDRAEMLDLVRRWSSRR